MATTTRNPGQILVSHPGNCMLRGILRSSAARSGFGGKNVYRKNVLEGRASTLTERIAHQKHVFQIAYVD